MKGLKTFVVAAVALCCAQAQATSVTEDFESVEVVDANGTPVASNYAAGAGLSNGRLVVGGGICKSADYSNFGLWSTAYNGSKVSLTAQYGSSNTAVVVIPVAVSGEFSFYACKTSTSSSIKGTVDIYETSGVKSQFKRQAACFDMKTGKMYWNGYVNDGSGSVAKCEINVVESGDMSGDGVVDIADVNAVINKVLGLK